MKKVLITGAGGFIGRNLMEQLAPDYELIAVTRNEADLLDLRQVEELFQKEDIDAVIHAATQSTLGKGKEAEALRLHNNLVMFLNLERCSSYYGKMLILGSGAEYDKRQDLSLVEEASFGKSVPADDYGLSKYLMSRLIRQSDNIYNLRLFGIFGQYENYNYRFISNIICKALSGQDIRIHQNVFFDYLYIKDFCRIVPWFIEHKPCEKYYNVCTGVRRDIVSIAKEILVQTESFSRLQVEKTGWNREYTGSNRRLIGEIGEFKFTSVERAISEMIVYYKNTPFHLEGSY